VTNPAALALQYLTNAVEMDDRAAHLLFAGDA
jgi:hypothetical protein